MGSLDCVAAGPEGAPALMFLHGMAMTPAMWAPQVAALADRYRVLALALPGHGSCAGGPFSMEAAVQAVAQVLEAQAGGRALLVGLSLGGFVAMEFASRRPQSVAGLVLADCTAVGRGPWGIPYRLAAWMVRRGGAGLLDRGNRLLTRWMYPRETAAPMLEAGFHCESIPEVVHDLHGQDFRSRLAAYPGPTLLLNGRFDWPFRRDEAKFLAAAQKGRLQIIPRAGHLSNAHNPAAFTAAVRAFAEEIGWGW